MCIAHKQCVCSVQRWCAGGLRGNIPDVRFHHTRRSMSNTCAKGKEGRASVARACAGSMGGPFERHSSLPLLGKQPRSAPYSWHQAASIRQRASGSGHERAQRSSRGSGLAAAHLTAVAAVKVRAFAHSAVELHQPIGTVMVAVEFC